MLKVGRKYFAIIAEAHTPANTGGIIDLSPKYSVEASELKSAFYVAPVAGTPGYLTVTFAGAYAVGDELRLTITSNLTGGQQFRKSYTHTVLAGAATVTDIALAFSLLLSRDVAAGQVYASAVPAAGVLTITQLGDDKRGIVGYVYTDSAAGTMVNVPTQTVYSEGQPSDLVDKGIPVGDINLASYDTVRIALEVGAAIPFIDSVGVTAKEIYWFGTPGEGQILVDLISGAIVTENVGAVAAGSSVVEEGDAVNHVTTITVDTTYGAIAGGANLGLGKLLYTFPAGAINIKASKIDIDLTALDGNIDADTPELGLGTVIASGAVAVLSGTATFEDILTGQVVADCLGTNTVKTVATSKVIETADAHTVHLNIADGWAVGGEVALPVTGTVTIEWSFMG